jgi:hypothetical protein
LWAVLQGLFDFNVQAPAMGDFPEPMDLGVMHVVLPGLFGGIAGWGVLAVLERFTSRARTIWLVVAVLVVLASLLTPLSGTGITVAQRLVLIVKLRANKRLPREVDTQDVFLKLFKDHSHDFVYVLQGFFTSVAPGDSAILLQDGAVSLPSFLIRFNHYAKDVGLHLLSSSAFGFWTII